MGQSYTLTLDKAAITYKNGIYTGASPESTWSPVNPDLPSPTAQGWQDGDILTINCTFDLMPTNITNPSDWPSASEYSGLCVGACSSTDSSAISGLKSLAQGLALPNVGQILTLSANANAPRIITNFPSTVPDTAIFYNATSALYTYNLPANADGTGSRGTLTNYVHQWIMTYNGNNTVVADSRDVEIIFGYGDPHVGVQGPPVS